jgi:hypothetical protein
MRSISMASAILLLSVGAAVSTAQEPIGNLEDYMIGTWKLTIRNNKSFSRKPGKEVKATATVVFDRAGYVLTWDDPEYQPFKDERKAKDPTLKGTWAITDARQDKKATVPFAIDLRSPDGGWMFYAPCPGKAMPWPIETSKEEFAADSSSFYLYVDYQTCVKYYKSCWIFEKQTPAAGGAAVATAAPDKPTEPPAEIRHGMSEEEVVKAFGPPSKKAVMPDRTIYQYDGMTVIFVDGKVREVNPR